MTGAVKGARYFTGAIKGARYFTGARYLTGAVKGARYFTGADFGEIYSRCFAPHADDIVGGRAVRAQGDGVGGGPGPVVDQFHRLGGQIEVGHLGAGGGFATGQQFGGGPAVGRASLKKKM